MEDLTLTNRFFEYFIQLCCCLCPPKMTEEAGGVGGDYKYMLYPVMNIWTLT